MSVSLSDSPVLASGGGQSPEFAMFVDGVTDPVDSGVTSHCLVGWVDTDYFVVFVHGILSYPVTAGICFQHNYG